MKKYILALSVLSLVGCGHSSPNSDLPSQFKLTSFGKIASPSANEGFYVSVISDGTNSIVVIRSWVGGVSVVLIPK